MAKQSKAEKQAAPKDSSKVWAMMSVVTGLIAAQLTKRLLNGGWKAATGKEPPVNPADPDVALREAVLWAAVSGTAIALARMLIGRRAANYYVKSTGHLPPELEADDVRERRRANAEAAAQAERGDLGKKKTKRGRRK